MKHFLFRAAWLAILAASGAPASPLPSVELTMVADSDSSIGDAGSSPHAFRTIDGTLWFAATTLQTGTELFRTDGTPGGVRLARDFAAGSASSEPVALGAAGGRVIVSADDGRVGRQLWALAADGAATRVTGGSFRADDLGALGNVGNRLLVYNSTNLGYTLLSIDGSAGGTVDLGTVVGRYSRPDQQCALGGAMVFLSDVSTIVRSDGTSAGTYTVGTVPSELRRSGAFAHAFGGQCYFLFSTANNGWVLYVADATPGSAHDIASGSGVPLGLSSLNGALYILQRETGRVRLLRGTSGSNAFTGVAEIPNSAGTLSFSSKLESIGGLLGFGAPYVGGWYSDIGYYVSDGTAAGTRRVHPVQASGTNGWNNSGTRRGLNGVFIRISTQVGYIDGQTGALTMLPMPVDYFGDGDTLNGAYVFSGAGAAGREPWRTDGTAAGTALLEDMVVSTANGFGSDGVGVAIGNVVYAGSATTGSSWTYDLSNSLVRSDGTPTGTVHLPAGAHPPGHVVAIVPFGDGVAFRLFHYATWQSSWYRADAALTSATALTGPRDYLSAAMAAGSRLIFGCATAGIAQEDLCGADVAGGAAGVMYPALPGASALRPLGNLGGVAVFGSANAVWRSDGTLPGTFTVADLPSYTQVGTAGVVFGGKLYFGTCREASSCVLRSTDGTRAGTVSVTTLAVGADIGAMTALESRFVFASSNNGFMQLWSSDGSAAGTQLLYGGSGWVPAIATVGGKAHVLKGCNGDECDSAYFVTAGVPGDLRTVALPRLATSTAGFLENLDDRAAVFPCATTLYYQELCIVDRDGDAGALVTSIVPTPRPVSPAFVARTPEGLYLTMADASHGVELWRMRSRPEMIFASGFEPRTADEGIISP